MNLKKNGYSDDPVKVVEGIEISRRRILNEVLHAFFLRLEMMKELNKGTISADHIESHPQLTQPSGKTGICLLVAIVESLCLEIFGEDLVN